MSGVSTIAPAGAANGPHPNVENRLVEGARVFFRNKAAILGLVLIVAILCMTLFADVIYPVDPGAIAWAPLTPAFTEMTIPLGTDYLGRDVLAGIIHGGKGTLAVGGAAALLTVIIGVVIGAFAGYYGGFIDEILMRITEFFQVLPPLLFAMVLVTVFSPSLVTVTVAIGLVSWPPTARLARAQFLSIRNLEYVTAARFVGAKPSYIIWQVILPNALPPLIVSATLVVGLAILFEAGLSFLGLSDPNVISWGFMIGSNRAYVLDAWWTVTFPGFAIFAIVLGVSLVGDGLNDLMNPRLRMR